MTMRLVDGNRVVIVGGGPAGSFSALHLLHYAAKAGLVLDITIVEPRDFGRPGPGGCNQCAGVLSSTLLSNLEILDLCLPPEIIQAELNAYILHLGKHEALIQKPDPGRRIASVYRGSGPRLGEPPFPRSFDGWLLEQAQKRGARLLRERVHTIHSGLHPAVVTDSNELASDLVILATGVNSRPPLDPAWAYCPPRTETMAQDEIYIPPGFLADQVHIFLDHVPGLIFGGLIPKDRYANVSLLGRGLPRDAINEFIQGHRLLSLVSAESSRLCGCAPHVAVSPARNYYADRMVAVGDAAVTRLYKDGIGAAFITAQAAARTAIQHGVSKVDFALRYRPVCQRIANDNFFGRLLFSLWNAARDSPSMLNKWQQAILAETRFPSQEQVYLRILWDVFTGDETYRKIFLLSLRPQVFSTLWLGALRPGGNKG